MSSIRFTSAALVLLTSLAVSAPVSQRPLTMADFDNWRTIQSQKLSPDGKYVAYALFPEEGDGELVARNLSTGKEWREPIGAQPPLGPANYAEPDAPPTRRSITLLFSRDGRTLVFSTFPAKAEIDKARKEKKTGDAAPKGGLVILDLDTGKAARFARIKNFQVPEKGDGFVAYLHEAPEAAKGAAPEKPQKPGTPKKEYGTELKLRKLSDGSERSFPDVLEYSLSKDARTLVYTVSSKASEDANGTYVVATTGGEPAAILKGKGRYPKMSWDEDQKRLALLSDRDDAASKQPHQKLYLWERDSAAATEVVSESTAGFPSGMAISDKGALTFSKDGRHLFFGVAPEPKPEKTAEDSGEEKAVFDLWHYKDDYIQPMQKVRAQSERTRSYRTVLHLDDHKLVALGGRTMPEITPSEDGLYALGGDDREYRSMVEYDTRYVDSYLVDTRTGAKTLLAKKHIGTVTWSPDSKHALLFNGKDWLSIATPSGASVNLTSKLGVNFHSEEHDTPDQPPAYGVAGWTKDGKYVLIYDHFDIWRVAADGGGAVNLTKGEGRKQRILFRYVKLDPEEKGIDPAKPLLLRAENDETHASGFYRLHIDKSEPSLEKLMIADKNFTTPQKAKEADVYLLTASTFREFPDLLVSDAKLQDFRKVSDANPQMAGFAWGSAELVKFHNADGVPLTATLYTPANFDPKKKYPMIVYIYEKLSQNVNQFVNPQPGNVINAAYYASNGYLVLQPDIVYTIGYPGQSALKCVLPAVQAVADRGFVNEKAIGIQGHSWGGYQIAYMVTQTDRFRAAAPGAVVANMVSAYNGIRWGPGLPRQFQYEHTQSRIGATLWQAPYRFLENSPVFMADRVKTPILTMHNDADDAVPWYQGIEFFLSLRRLGKEIYLFDYNGEPHNLRKRANQKDYAMRLQQFFDYYLKGAPKPDWMEHGIPFLEKEAPEPATVTR